MPIFAVERDDYNLPSGSYDDSLNTSVKDFTDKYSELPIEMRQLKEMECYVNARKTAPGSLGKFKFNAGEGTLHRDELKVLKEVRDRLTDEVTGAAYIHSLLAGSSEDEEIRLLTEIVSIAVKYGQFKVKRPKKDSLLDKLRENIKMAQTVSVENSKKNADEFAGKLIPVFDELNRKNIHTLQGIADELNKRPDIKPRKGDTWYASNVSLVKKRIDKLTTKPIEPT